MPNFTGHSRPWKRGGATVIGHACPGMNTQITRLDTQFHFVDVLLTPEMKRAESVCSAMVTCDVDDSGPVIALKLTGDAVMANAVVLHERLLAAVVPGRDLVVDIEGLDRLDASGVQLLLALAIMVERGGAAMTLRAVTGAARSALENAAADPILFGTSIS